MPRLRIENWLEPDELAEIEEAEEEDAASRNGGPVPEGDGTVRHPGVVPQLEERVRAAAERAASQPDQADHVSTRPTSGRLSAASRTRGTTVTAAVVLCAPRSR